MDQHCSQHLLYITKSRLLPHTATHNLLYSKHQSSNGRRSLSSNASSRERRSRAYQAFKVVLLTEQAIITSDAAMAARTTLPTEATATARQVGSEALNPLAMREAVEATARQAVNKAGEWAAVCALRTADSRGEIRRARQVLLPINLVCD